mgnify:CR=1 FL=1
MKNILCLVFCVFFVQFTNAQLFEELKSRLKKTATTKASDFNTSRSNKEKNVNSNNLSEPVSGEGKGNVEEERNENPTKVETNEESEYDFIVRGAYNWLSPGSGKEVAINYSVGENAYCIHNEGSKRIHDVKNKKIVMLNDPSMVAFVMDDEVKPVQSTKKEDVMRATGRSKTILGYNCLEYELIGQNSSIWISENMNLSPKLLASYRQMESSFLGLSYSTLSGLNGLVMELRSKQKPDSHFVLSSFSLQAEKVNLKAYKKTGN